MTAHTLPGGRPLDPDRPITDEPRPAPAPAPDPGPAPQPDAPPAPKAPREQPPGLKRQAGATKDALLALVRAHIDLGKAEAGEIAGEVKVVAAAAGVAFGALLLLAFLLPIGLFLFFGEWLFGSLGWGVLHGTELLVLVAVAAVLGALNLARIGRSIALAFVAGAVVAVLLGTNAPNRLYSLIADQLGTLADPGLPAIGIGAAIGAVIVGLLGAFGGARNGSAGDAGKGLVGGAILGAIAGAVIGGLVRLAADEGSRPLVVGVVIVGVVVGLVGLVLGARSSGIGGAVTGVITGVVLGGVVGAFSAITFTWHVAIAIGIALFLGLATALMVADVAANGIDTDALKARFYPKTTIDTTKETIEWAKARIPGARRS